MRAPGWDQKESQITRPDAAHTNAGNWSMRRVLRGVRKGFYGLASRLRTQ